METWGDRAKAVLKQQNRTIDDLAEKRGMTPGGMQKWLAGTREPSLADIIAIADELQVSRNWLLLGDEAKGPLDGLPPYAAETLLQIAQATRDGQLDQHWFACLTLAIGLIHEAKGLKGPMLDLRNRLAHGQQISSEEARYLAAEFDRVTDPAQRRLAFAQTQHMLRLMNQDGAHAERDTTLQPSAQQK